eukprot:193646-Chlamydomonas_euryale.AAC.2
MVLDAGSPPDGAGCREPARCAGYERRDRPASQMVSWLPQMTIWPDVVEFGCKLRKPFSIAPILPVA